ncbi:MAG: GIY-YIG nuclease family protein [Verrucomicrobiota bacterium]
MSDSEYTYVYILVSKIDPARLYVWITADFNTRLKKHNQGGVPHTSRFRPWTDETVLRFRSKEKAIAFEKYLKSGSGREFSRRRF